MSFNICNLKGNVCDTSGNKLYSLRPVKPLGTGANGQVDLFEKISNDGKIEKVALKRVKNYMNTIQGKIAFTKNKEERLKEYEDSMNKLYHEAKFQKELHERLKEYELSFSVPYVIDIIKFQLSGSISFIMEPFEPIQLSEWLETNFSYQDMKLFAKLMLQLALILEIFEDVFNIDHRDLKANNIIVVNEEVSMNVNWKNTRKTVSFPFRLVFIDFGYACEGGVQDVKHNSYLPPVDPCPKDGRDVYQILASLWSSKGVRALLKNTLWGSWIKQKLESAYPKLSIEFIENAIDLWWLRTCTDDPNFKAPLCEPWKIIEDCFKVLEDE